MAVSRPEAAGKIPGVFEQPGRVVSASIGCNEAYVRMRHWLRDVVMADVVREMFRAS
jgi:hypothetical protein